MISRARLLAAVLAAALLAPSALASHYTLYHTGGRRTEIGTFELNDAGAPTHGNQNGPAGEERRPIPADPDVPRRFRNLSDMLVSDLPPPAGARGTLILDHQMYGSTVETGHLVPYGYYAGAATGAPRTTPTSMHALWYGWWDDVDADGVIDDEWCAGNGLHCTATDEFAWRGGNTGEKNISALAYFFPGDYDGSTGSLGRFEPSGLAGDCMRFTDNAGCINPGPDMPYADSTANEGNANNQRWAGNNGGGQLTAEEFLLVSQHVVSVVGDKVFAENSPEQYRVDCQPPAGCMRDYDWYGALAGETVDDLYLGAMRGARDCVWSWYWVLPDCAFGNLPVPDEVKDVLSCLDWWGECRAAEILEAEPCPHGIPSEFYGCVPDTRHLDARGDGGSSLKAYARQTFDSVVPAVGTPQIGPVPPQGFYGDFDVERNTFQPYSSHAEGPLIRVWGEAWLWRDRNGDGYLGDPSDEELALYAMGLDNSPNDGGDCDENWGGDCELIPRADVYAGRVAVVTPGAAGWPPGAMQLNNYERGYWGELGFESPPGGWHQGPLVGTQPATLRMDGERCNAQYFGCRSIDAVLVPGGSAGGLRGEFAGGIVLTWSEGSATYSVTFPGVWEARL